MLTDRAVWMQWAHADHTAAGPWALLPTRPKVVEVVPTSEHQAQTWAYTTSAPPANWTQADFDDAAWTRGTGGLRQQRRTPHGLEHTRHLDPAHRRGFTVPAGSYHQLEFYLWHDDDVELFVNGVLAGKAAGYTTQYEPLAIRPAAAALLKPGCHRDALRPLSPVQGRARH